MKSEPIILPASRMGQVEEYYFSRKLKEIASLRADGKKVINLGIGSPDQAPDEEVIQTLHDLRAAKVDVVTIGQYLQPSKKHLPVKEFITPEQFEKYEKIGKELGFIHVESGPLVRSSYHAEKHIH
jgi:lipoic acid synthetase